MKITLNRMNFSASQQIISSLIPIFEEKRMTRLYKPIALIGFIVVFTASIFCPFLKVPLQANWNLYQVDSGLFFITLGILGLSVLLFFMRKLNAFRISAIVLVLWIVLSFVLVYLQINNFFGLKIIDGLLAKTLQLRWGWVVLMLGALLIYFSVRKGKEIALDTEA